MRTCSALIITLLLVLLVSTTQGYDWEQEYHHDVEEHHDRNHDSHHDQDHDHDHDHDHDDPSNEENGSPWYSRFLSTFRKGKKAHGHHHHRHHRHHHKGWKGQRYFKKLVRKGLRKARNGLRQAQQGIVTLADKLDSSRLACKVASRVRKAMSGEGLSFDGTACRGANQDESDESDESDLSREEHLSSEERAELVKETVRQNPPEPEEGLSDEEHAELVKETVRQNPPQPRGLRPEWKEGAAVEPHHHHHGGLIRNLPKMSIKALKAHMRIHQVECTDCIEKNHLVEALVAHHSGHTANDHQCWCYGTAHEDKNTNEVEGTAEEKEWNVTAVNGGWWTPVGVELSNATHHPPVTISYEVRANYGNSEAIGAFSFTRAQWGGGGGGEDALTWYVAPHRSDFGFRTKMFADFPKHQVADGRGGAARPARRLTPGQWHRVDVRISRENATYSLDGHHMNTALLHGPPEVPFAGYVGMVRYASDYSFRKLKVWAPDGRIIFPTDRHNTMVPMATASRKESGGEQSAGSVTSGGCGADDAKVRLFVETSNGALAKLDALATESIGSVKTRLDGAFGVPRGGHWVLRPAGSRSSDTTPEHNRTRGAATAKELQEKHRAHSETVNRHGLSPKELQEKNRASWELLKAEREANDMLRATLQSMLSKRPPATASVETQTPSPNKVEAGGGAEGGTESGAKELSAWGRVGRVHSLAQVSFWPLGSLLLLLGFLLLVFTGRVDQQRHEPNAEPVARGREEAQAGINEARAHNSIAAIRARRLAALLVGGVGGAQDAENREPPSCPLGRAPTEEAQAGINEEALHNDGDLGTNCEPSDKTDPKMVPEKTTSVDTTQPECNVTTSVDTTQEKTTSVDTTQPEYTALAQRVAAVAGVEHDVAHAALVATRGDANAAALMCVEESSQRAQLSQPDEEAAKDEKGAKDSATPPKDENDKKDETDTATPEGTTLDEVSTEPAVPGVLEVEHDEEKETATSAEEETSAEDKATQEAAAAAAAVVDQDWEEVMPDAVDAVVVGECDEEAVDPDHIEALRDLLDMGFHDEVTNARTLTQVDWNVRAAVRVLVAAERDARMSTSINNVD